jgi:hypothetical protein
MGIRDDEINRIKKYAQGLGVIIKFVPYFKGAGAADWSWQDKTINIYMHSGVTKISIILSLLHEIGHHLDWIYKNKQTANKVETAYTDLVQGMMHGQRTDLNQETRNIILKEELDAIHYMSIIYKELDLKFPYWRLKVAQAMDAFDYKMLAKQGRFSTGSEYRDYKNKMKKYYKNRYKNK